MSSKVASKPETTWRALSGFAAAQSSRLKWKARHESELAWRYVFNFGPSLSYRWHAPALEGEPARVVDDLRRDGIAVSTVDALGLDREFDAIATAAGNELGAGLDEGAGEKHFVDSVLGSMPPLDLSSPYARFCLHPTVRAIANAYFGMFTQLRFYDVWRNRVTGEALSASQLWHRDREDYLILKVFVYLSDVDTGAGPFRYARGTHRLGPTRTSAPSFDEHGVARSTDEQLAEIVPRERWVDAVGLAGTIVFADTAGYHCGGRNHGRERILFNCLFTSRDSQVREWFGSRPSTGDPRDAETSFAIGVGRRGPAWVLR